MHSFTSPKAFRRSDFIISHLLLQSARLEHRLQTRLRVVGIVDPAIARAEAVLDHKINSFVAMAYSETRLCNNLDEFVKGMKPTDTPQVVIIGSPAAFHGSDL